MNPLTPRERELVALGAALASNCVPCIEHHVPEARRLGLTDGQLREAVELANQIRLVPAANVLAAANQALDCPQQVPYTQSAEPDCPCASLARQPSRCC